MSLTTLLSYTYTSLDELRSRSTAQAPPVQVFHQHNGLIVEINGQRHCRVLRGGTAILAQLSGAGDSDSRELLLTDKQHSVVGKFSSECSHFHCYTAYGHTAAGAIDLQGFNGERREPVSGHYLLGSYRAFNPVLMRFNKPDTLSPFGKGGLNTYAYCAGDPVNRADPSGHSFLSGLQKLMGIGAKRNAKLLLERRNILANNLRNEALRRISNRLAGVGPYLVKRPKVEMDWVNIRDFTKLDAKHAHMYTNSDGSEFHIRLHGVPGQVELPNQRLVSGQQFADNLEGLYNPATVKRINLHMCYSATAPRPGLPSTAESVARTTGKPTTGYAANQFDIYASTDAPGADPYWYYYSAVGPAQNGNNIGTTFLPKAIKNVRRVSKS
ncbi:RHS repeat-associated core domain-containing protein [Pseudomonas sp. SDI]|uniref:RHS repeat-associated core domain-containing protein n=1 Tax=Pseudomonas sp. SDI TaxID=2170734 RepID=UPI002114769E|nr:RHS repeat-associated core domain-containing protein [Pseudomonas sp. SDI]